ncbi:CLUMA_CG015134, isoform A [Clunio marinus]|uniref:Eclosion hormone n=1 Tax=Clunio marinus TaxID=568069 RepID=A0A1J1IPT5_9DIPT|nr:CLUMA_CG015134, isoform A [Clunio marinus]
MPSMKIMLLLSAIVLTLYFIENTAGNPYPSIDLFGGYDILGVCLRNCAQCKKMFGSFFEGQLCADSCVKFKGKVIPDCEDLASIAPFLSTKTE